MGCGEERQCIWLPYPHHIDPWCAGVDFLNDIDYRGMAARGAQLDAVARGADVWTRPRAGQRDQRRLFLARINQTRPRRQLYSPYEFLGNPRASGL